MSNFLSSKKTGVECTTMEHSTPSLEKGTLAAELSELQLILESFRRDMHANLPSNLAKMTSGMTDDLDSLTSAIMQAAATIRENCDSILDRLQNLDDNLYQSVETDIIRVYDACVFQDLAGHSMRLMGTNLWKVEEKIARLLHLLAEQKSEFEFLSAVFEEGKNKSKSQCMSQNAIDRLVSRLMTKRGDCI